MFPLRSDKAKLFTEKVSENSNLDNPGNSLPAFHSRTNLELRNVPITSILVKKVISDLDSPKGFWSSLYSSGGCREQ